MSRVRCLVAVAGAFACGSPRAPAVSEHAGDARTVRDAGDAALPTVTLVGRFDVADPATPRFAWSGSAITTRFDGSSIAVELDEAGQGNRYHVIVDGQLAPSKLATTPGRRSYPLATGLPAGVHEVTLVRLTEALFGETRLVRVALEGGATPAPTPSRRQRRIEIVGDSLSAGYGNEGADQHCPFGADTENHYLTYGAIAARRLDADLVTVAWSGKGVVSNRGSTTDTVTMPTLWTRTLPEVADSAWDFARYAPDVVVINLGSNDLAPDNPDWSPLAAGYLAFVRQVRARYPRAHIIAAVGPALSDTYPEGRRALSTGRSAVKGAVAALAAAGNRAISSLEFPQHDGSTGYGCDWHPSLATHARMAVALEAELRARLGW